MLFTDISSERIVAAFLKISLRIVKQGKHITMSDGCIVFLFLITKESIHIPCVQLSKMPD